jgi:hypothetical protein
MLMQCKNAKMTAEATLVLSREGESAGHKLAVGQTTTTTN